MRRADLLRIVGILGGLALAAPAQAACSVSVTGVAFGTYNPTSGPDDATGTVEATCLIFDGAPVVSIGTGVAGTFSPRRMRNGTSNLNYNLYTAASRTLVWGDGSQGSATVTLTPASQFIIWYLYERTIFGRIPSGQHVRAGAYSDAIVVTVTF